MAKKNNTFDKFTLAAIILIVIAVLFFAYSFMLGIKAPSISYSNNLGQFKIVNPATISAIKELNACGNWPIPVAGVNEDRGNPFNRKGSAQSQMVATSAVYCLPVTQ